MFHRVQGKKHQFIRSTYDPSIGRCKQKVVVTLGLNESLNPSDERLTVLTADERAYLLDWVKTKEATELDEQQEFGVKFAKDKLEALHLALKKYPPDQLAACDIFEACSKISQLVGSIVLVAGRRAFFTDVALRFDGAMDDETQATSPTHGRLPT